MVIKTLYHIIVDVETNNIKKNVIVVIWSEILAKKRVKIYTQIYNYTNMLLQWQKKNICGFISNWFTSED